MAGAGNDRDDILADINVTPLVDVMLVLLVVMMVTASTIVTQSLSVELPSAKTGGQPDAPPERPLMVVVTRQGQLLLDDRRIEAASLRREIDRRRAASRQGNALTALVAADAATSHGRVVEVLDLLRSARVDRVAVGVRPQVE